MTVHVTAVTYDGYSTIATGEGINEYDDGSSEVIRFAGDWRMMRDISDALDEGEDVVVEIESWQIIGVDAS